MALVWVPVRPLRTSVAMALLSASIVVAAAAPAKAAEREFGEMVEYDLEFPVDGAHHFWDTFWAARSHGPHHSQDLMAGKMVRVVAAADGTVRLVNWSSRLDDLNPERCCTLVIRHDDGWESWYIHLNNDTPGTDDGRAWGIADGITPGVRVSRGQLVAWVGDSGNAEHTAPHLHFELRDPEGTIVNPYQALRAAGGNGPPPSDALFDGSRLLGAGDRGTDVRRLQEVLVGLGLRPGPIDGVFGPMTEAAVRAFQSGRGLVSDGLVGRVTRGELEQSAPLGEIPFDRILREGDRGEDVGRLQALLSAAGFPPGPIDGILGSRTLLAVISLQEALGLVVDGLVGPQTLAALGS